MAFHPFLTLWDPLEGSDSSLDPLGLYQIADNLALKLVPAVRERMRHPRFLTAIAAGAAACARVPEDKEPADGISPPWQVYEWHYVEALSMNPDERGIGGMPGSLKVKAAIADKKPIGARTYLKTPSVFGFHGVYRLFSEKNDIVEDGLLGSQGAELLEVWEREQQVPGFFRGEDGIGKTYRKKITDAILFGLDTGHTRVTQEISDFFLKHLHFLDPGPREADMLLRLLRSSPGHGFRSELLDIMMQPEARTFFESEWEEMSFHEWVYPRVGEACQKLLFAIRHYEAFSRLLQNAFNEMMTIAGERGGRASVEECAKGEMVRQGAERSFELYQAAEEHLAQINDATRFTQLFNAFAISCSAEEWCRILHEHHLTTQRNKPPDGKAPWLVTTTDGRLMLMSVSLLKRVGSRIDGYVHTYRTNSLRQFLIDLRKV